MNEVYASLTYDGAPLLRVPVCVSRALLVTIIDGGQPKPKPLYYEVRKNQL